METGYIKLKPKNLYGLDQVGGKIKTVFNVADENISSHQKEQKRYGLNIGGGEYYLFEVMGMEIYLIKNQGEVEIYDTDWSFYLKIEFNDNIDADIFNGMVNFVVVVLQQSGFDAELD